MFKKKSSALPRPTPPGPKHMLEDLSNVEKDDIIFTLLKNNTSAERCTTHLNSDEEEMEHMSKDSKNSSGIGTMYGKVKSFVEENNELQTIMKDLQEKHESLQMSDMELKKMAEDIRKQAIDALK